MLGGGLPAQLVEVSGPAGVGKTQLALHLAVTEAARGGSVLFLYTEGSFPSERALQMVPRDAAVSSPLDRVFYEEVGSPEALADILQRQLGAFCAKVHVSAIIVDSVAGLFRATESVPARALDLWRVAAALKRISHDAGCPVLLTNQVAADLDKDGADKPALGMAWAHLVTHRLVLHRVDDARVLSVLSSPFLEPRARAVFHVTPHGL